MTPKIPILIINLASAKERRSAMRLHLEGGGFEFEFVPAVDGRSFDMTTHPAYDPARRKRAFRRDLTGGELGCLLSHRAILERMVAQQIEQVLVLEDDAILGPDFSSVLASILECPVPFDAIRFFGDTKAARRRQRPVYHLGKAYWLSRLATTPGGAQAYLIRLQGARKLLPFLQRSWLPVDILMGRSWEHGLRWFTVHPAVTDYDRSLESDIGLARYDKKTRLSGTKRLAFHFGRIAFLVSTAIGKRRVYWATYFADRRWRNQSLRRQPASGLADKKA